MLGPASSGSMSSPLIPVAPNGGERLALVDRLLVDIACMGELHRARRANGSEVAFKELPNDDVGLRKAAYRERWASGRRMWGACSYFSCLSYSNDFRWLIDVSSW